MSEENQEKDPPKELKELLEMMKKSRDVAHNAAVKSLAPVVDLHLSLASLAKNVADEANQKGMGGEYRVAALKAATEAYSALVPADHFRDVLEGLAIRHVPDPTKT